ASSTMNTVSVSLTACASTVSALFFALSLAIEFHLKVADCIHDLLIFDYFRFVDGCICELRTACLRIKYSRTGYRAPIFFSNRKSDFVIVYYAPICRFLERYFLACVACACYLRSEERRVGRERGSKWAW